MNQHALFIGGTVLLLVAFLSVPTGAQINVCSGAQKIACANQGQCCEWDACYNRPDTLKNKQCSAFCGCPTGQTCKAGKKWSKCKKL